MSGPTRFGWPRQGWIALALLLGAGGLGAAVYAQIEGGDRGVAPIDSSGAFEVGGIAVDVSAKTADAARFGGWREAQRRGWRMLWQKTHGGGGGAPMLSDSALDAIVAGIVVENEQIGPNRYVATLGVLFDRARAGQILGISGGIRRSPPLLVIPIQVSGGTARVFEQRTPWQEAWARFRSGESTIDYVRPSGSGPDPMLLNAAQVSRPGRRWWRLLLDQYGAADVVIPLVNLERQWPGGPVVGHFSVRYGPDNRLLDRFSLRVESGEALPQMLDQGVRRIDQIYQAALASGQLRPDRSLIIEEPVDPEELEGEELPAEMTADADETGGPIAAGTNQVSIQFETPDVASVGAAEAAVRSAAGVRSASTVSLALGGVSVMRVSFDGDVAALRAALQARGFQVEGSGSVLRIRRPGRAAAAPGEQ